MWAVVVLWRGRLPGMWLSVCTVGLAWGLVDFVGNYCPGCGLLGAVLGCPRSVVGWPRKNGKIAGTPLGPVLLVAVQGMCWLFGCLTRRYSVVAVEVRLDVALGKRE